MNHADALARTRELLDHHGLPDWKPTLINTKNILGQCAFGPKQIRLSKTYVEHNDLPDVEQTILHEIAHALHGPVYKHGKEKAHGPRWKMIARQIGVKNPGHSSHAEMPERRWVATCPTCGKVIAQRHVVIPKARRFRGRCHSEIVVWTDRHAATKPARPAPAAMLDLDYGSMTPGQKAAYTKRIKAAAQVEAVASPATLPWSDQSGGIE